MPRHPLADVRTWTDPIKRWIACPYCAWRASAFRRGIGANALGASATLRGQLTAHIKARHPEVLANE